MTQETWYVCKDGMKFNDKAKAEQHEKEVLEAEARTKAQQEEQEELLAKIKDAEAYYVKLIKEYNEKYGTPNGGCVFGYGFVDSLSDLAKTISDTVMALFD